MKTNPDSPTQANRRTIFFTGRVQGVGFRFTVHSVASRFSITGYVKNLPDGRVVLVSEGNPSELDRFQHAVEEAMRSNIREVQVKNTNATGEFSQFGINY